LSANSVSALLLAKSFIIKKHTILQFFFQGEGAYFGLPVAPSSSIDTPQITEQWHNFAQENNIPLLICTNSAANRGLFTIEHKILSPWFQIAGLSQFIEASLLSDRVIQFA